MMHRLYLGLMVVLMAWPVAAEQESASTPASVTAATRPRIGLALGGGGALGLAHIGILKELEAQRIPIDVIGGTSMGAIVAGLYACGMSPGEIEVFISGLDWNEVMSDATPRRELYFRRKQDDQRYLFEMGLKRDGLKLGTGMVAGQKFNNLMQLITLRAADITDFDQLPTPYRAVATDLESGRPYVISGGNMATAMRASMAVPGAFTPVEIDGRLLVDGGVVNNLPVDVIKAMGVDIVIAVDVGSAADTVDRDRLRTLGGILGRTYAIAQRPNSLEQLQRADIVIQPPLAGFTASQFQRVCELIPVGERAAQAHVAELAPHALSPEDYDAFRASRRRPAPDRIIIHDVVVEGHQRVNAAIVRGRLRSRPGEAFDADTIQRDLMRAYGIGEFEHILFRLDRSEDGDGVLRYQIKEKAWGPTYLAFGLRLQSDFENDADWNMLLNITRRSLNALGAEWRNEIEFGSMKVGVSEFYQPLDVRGDFFLAPRVEYHSELENVYENDRRVAEYKVHRTEARLDFGIQLRRYAEFRIGPLWGTGKAEVETGASDQPEFDERYAGWAAQVIIDRQDRTLFAREGYYADLRARLAREIMGGERDFDQIMGVSRYQRSFGDHTITISLQGGSSLGSDLPGYAQFQLGGPFGFAGLADGQFRGSYLGVGSLGYRLRLMELPAQLGRGLYAITRFDTGNVWPDDVALDDLRYGGTVGVGADSTMGPISLLWGAADGGYTRYYFSLGTVF